MSTMALDKSFTLTCTGEFALLLAMPLFMALTILTMALTMPLATSLKSKDVFFELIIAWGMCY